MNLNSEQKKAVQSTNGRILVLAGAGSGKTRVIIQRILYLIKKKDVAPSSILGLTFTNKAAKEMQNRLQKLLGAEAKKVLLTTFHSFCVQVLRKEIHHLGYTKQFSLYDEKDMTRLMKNIAKECIDEKNTSLTEILQELQNCRTKNIDPSSEEAKAILSRLKGALRAYNALDFDHLLTLTCELFENHPHILEKYQNIYRYISIDEYQDTNPTQFRLAELLAKKHRNLFVVGDDDQSIYGFRGADMKNILHFEADSIIKLEQNYRSNPIILQAANAVIQNNKNRYEKKLWCDKKDTSKVSVFNAPNEELETKAIVDRILSLITHRNYTFGDIAILYRSNILARSMEKALLSTTFWSEGKLNHGIPCEVFGGLSFSERAEIKDLSAYLKTLINPLDQEALLRIINVPRRGISDQTLDKLTKKSREKKIPLYQLLKSVESEEITPRAKKSIRFFVDHIEETKKRLEKDSYARVFSEFLEEISYKKAIEEDVKSEKMRQFKSENVRDFLDSLELFEEEEPDATLEDYLSASSLTKISLKKRSEANTVKLMTLHSAKGLEFKACFLMGLEDHILPHEKSQMEGGIEEERRLFYVGITRAEEYLCMSMAKSRKKMGKDVPSSPSRFLFEIPKSCLAIEAHQK